MLSNKLLMQQDSSSGDIPEGVSFDGATDYLSRSSDLVGNVDSKTFTFSCWVYKSEITNYLYSKGDAQYSNANRMYIAINNTGVYITCYDAAGTQVVNINTTGVYPNDTFLHVLISVDVGHNNVSIYVNDKLQPITITTLRNTNIVTTAINHYISAAGWNLSLYKHRLSHLFLDYTYRDLSIEANRRLFITAAGKPAKGLEALNPIIYLPMKNKETAHINLGTGGDFVQNGLIETADRGANQDNCVASKGYSNSTYLSRNGPFPSTNKITISLVETISTSSVNVYSFLARHTSGSIHNVLSHDTYNGRLFFQFWDNTGGTTDLMQVPRGTYGIGSKHQVAISMDWVNKIGKIAVDGIVVVTKTLTGASVGIDWIDTMWIGGSNITNVFTPDSVGEFYVDTTYIDLSTNNPFWDSTTNKPVPVRKVMANLGSNPLICMPLDASNPGKNYGRGGDFTLYGGGLVGARGASEYIARSAKFDGGGSLDLQAYNGGASGNTASFVFAVKCHATSSSICGFQSTNNGVTYPRCRFYGDGGDYLRLVVEDSTGINLNITINNVQTPLDTWHLIQISFDMTDSTKTRVYVDGVVGSYTLNKHSGRPINWSAFVTAFIGRDYTAYTSQHQTISAIYFTTDYIDFSQEANRNLFINQLGYPRDLRPEIEAGNIPTPLIYLPFDDPTNLGKNLGTAGDFAVNGTVTPGQDFSI